MEIKVLGTGCTGCRTLYETVTQAIAELGISAAIVKEEDITEILSYGVMTLPGLVVDGRVVSAGRRGQRVVEPMKAATLLLAAALLYACGGSRHRVTVEAVADDCVQVLYFHGKQRCATCTAIERLTREVIDSIGSEKVVLRIIDIAENEALADRYQAGWSALILDRNGRVENLTRMGFSYAKDQPATFKARLNDAITRMSK